MLFKRGSPQSQTNACGGCPGLQNLQEEPGLRNFFIFHDLGVIRYLCDDVAVIYRARRVESGTVADIFDRPQNEYTRMLLDAMPDPDPDRSPFRTAASI